LKGVLCVIFDGQKLNYEPYILQVKEQIDVMPDKKGTHLDT